MSIPTVTSEDHRALQTIADTIHSSKRILVVTGAGISTNSGIPDFRSTHGLYNVVKSRYPPSISSNSISAGKDLFSSSLFTDPISTSIFYSFLAELRESVLRVEDTTPTHKFIRTLAESGRLLRCYTQNIDGLEGREGLATDLSLGKGGPVNSKKRKRCSMGGVAGEVAAAEGTGVNDEGAGEVVTAPKRGCQVVQLHGELDTLRCMHCQGTCAYDEEKVAALMEGRAPDCPLCVVKDRERREAGKRGTRVGGLRPNIVLYGEEHPQGDAIGKITSADLKSGPDMMIIFGTSLKVHGLKRLVKEFAASIHARTRKATPASEAGKEASEGNEDAKGKGKQDIPRVVFVNNQPAANSVWKDVIDAWVDMDCDEFVAEIKRRRPAVWERQERLEAGFRRAAEGKSGSGKGGRVVKAPSLGLTNKVKMGSKVKAARKAQTPPEESDKENSSSSCSSACTSPSKTKAQSTPQKKKSPLVSASSSKANTLGSITLATPKHKKTPLPTPPSSISKPRGGESSRSKYFTASPSMSPLSSLASTPSLPGTPTRCGLRSFRFECPTPSRVRNAIAFAAEAREEEEEEEFERTPSKRRKMKDEEGEDEDDDLMDISPLRRNLFGGIPRGKLMEAVVINSPARAPNLVSSTSRYTPSPPLADPPKKPELSKKTTEQPVIVQCTITTRSRVTKSAGMKSGGSIDNTEKKGKLQEKDNSKAGSREEEEGKKTVNITTKEGIIIKLANVVKGKGKGKRTWRVGERKSERRRSDVV